MDDAGSLKFFSDGAQLFKGALGRRLIELEVAILDLPTDSAGVRIHGIEALKPFMEADGCIGAIAASVLGKQAKPVRAILFDKTPGTNWSLAWHQDRTICVKEKFEADGFGPWTIKSGLLHVAPPFDLLTRMVTLRAHLDPVPMTNAPLLVSPGSHTQGRIPVEEVEQVVERFGIAVCTAEAGDIWLYATPILHASEAAFEPKSRRVLQVDFAAEDLPHGLKWLGI
ncbi:phytanoyl-CoA dioxygenase [Erythrobacter vulgaris]|uniref:Phytanoyl-CoA dioxygenase n=1 Tax=Qipengyuania vulgaris TaxID=291985 RepID=A0A844XW91_9SPHN|nr:phytanoyl-CoA dioxygenase family protein [Qipengyuania vulgaris]MXO49218.1 phytanoyl-CoA dioxygenase [Qipengyuania vulgaris]